jgi:long-chain acyl-CoA synthetase
MKEDEEIADNEAARSLIKKEIDRINKTLANFEIIKKHAILKQPFTIDGGELTPTLKVKRKVVKEKYAPVIAELRR